MPDHPTPPAALSPRLQRPTWRDPRLLVGILLVLVSVFAVVGIVRAGDRTQAYLAAAHDIRVGETVKPEDLRTVDVSLADAGEGYLPRDAQLAEGAVATQPIFSGQLIPRSSIGAADSLHRKPMSLTLPRDQTGGLEVGQSVDVWVTDQAQAGQDTPDPARAVTGSEIARITRDDTAIGGSDQVTVQVLVEEEDLPSLIRASASDARVTLVPMYRSLP